jgi:CRP-like cAMP-binding protein
VQDNARSIDLAPLVASVADPRIRWLPLTQQEIGDDLGLTVVQVNRVRRRRFREAGRATVRGGTAVIHNPPRSSEARSLCRTFRARHAGIRRFTR